MFDLPSSAQELVVAMIDEHLRMFGENESALMPMIVSRLPCRTVEAGVPFAKHIDVA